MSRAVCTTSKRAWMETGPEEVASGVFRIPLPMPNDGLEAVNVYAIESDDGLNLIDGGWAVDEARSTLVASLKAIGHEPQEVRRVLVTHSHRDHYTLAVALRAEYGDVHLVLGEADRPTVEFAATGLALPYADRLASMGAADEAIFWRGHWNAANAPDPADWQSPDEWMVGECHFDVGPRQLTAIPTPGHTQGHYVYADLEGGLLFSGDHILPRITPSIGFEIAEGDDPLGRFLESQQRILDLPDLRLLPAHGGTSESTHARAGELIDHHEVRLAETLAAVTASRCTPWAVARVLPWTSRATHYDRLTPFNGGLATLETHKHLEHLVARGSLARRDLHGVATYLHIDG